MLITPWHAFLAENNHPPHHHHHHHYRNVNYPPPIRLFHDIYPDFWTGAALLERRNSKTGALKFLLKFSLGNEEARARWFEYNAAFNCSYVCVCVCIYIYTWGSVQIAGSCTGRPLGICIRNATTLASSAVGCCGVAAKDEEPADCRADGRASGWRNEWAECACVGGTRGSYTCLQLPRLGNEGQSSPGLRAGEDKSRGNERVNRFAACTSFSSASSFSLFLLFGGLIDFRW